MKAPHLPTPLAAALAATLMLAAGGCSTFFQPMHSSKAETGYHSQVIDDLQALPPPAQKIVVAVYKLRDQTGQYKQSSTSSLNYSTAVTQGATSMLIKALEDAGMGSWFTVVERESLPNLLNERKIIRQTRLQYMTKEELANVPQLPPLIYAPVILDGGIVAYETNLLTGGMGAKYLGIGGDTQFQRDTVTTVLRAVSVKDGQVLKSVQTAKTIFSVKLDTGVFRYVGFKDLLEAEAGISSNEPPQMAVLESIERGVYSMIMEGVRDGLWNFKDQATGQRLLRAYLEEKNVKPVPVYGADGELEGFTRPEPAQQPAEAAAPAEPQTDANPNPGNDNAPQP